VEPVAMAYFKSLGLVENQVQAELKAKRANHEWLTANKKALREEFADKYVAVLDQKVVASAGDINYLFRKLRSAFTAEVLATVAIDLITVRDIIWIL
jgi:hypothetical protein